MKAAWLRLRCALGWHRHEYWGAAGDGFDWFWCSTCGAVMRRERA